MAPISSGIRERPLIRFDASSSFTLWLDQRESNDDCYYHSFGWIKFLNEMIEETTLI